MGFVVLLHKEVKGILGSAAYWVLAAIFCAGSIMAASYGYSETQAGILFDNRADMWLGITVALISFHSIILSRTVVEEKRSKISELLLTSTKPITILGSKIVASTLGCLIQYVLLLAFWVGSVDKLEARAALILTPGHFLNLLGYCAITSLAFGVLFAYSSLYARDEKEASTISILPFALLTTQGVFCKAFAARVLFTTSFNYIPFYSLALGTYQYIKSSSVDSSLFVNLGITIVISGLLLKFLSSRYKALIGR